MKKSITLTFFLLFLCTALHAQTADFIQSLLQTKAVSYEQAARFVLAAAEVITLETSEEDAMDFAVGKKWLPQKAKAQDAISLERLSLLVMRAFNLKGGPMYTWFNSAHYSYREMVFQDFIRGRHDPQMKVSGENMHYIVSRVLFLIDDNPWEFSVGADQHEEIPAGMPEDEQ